MSNVQQFILSLGSNNEKARGIAAKTAKALEIKETTLVDIVQSLGDYINDEDVTNRGRAMDYLAQVTAALPPKLLSKQQVQVLCQFFCDRIEDGGAVGGLKRLQAMDRYNSEMAVLTFRAIIEHFQDLQLRPQSSRLQILDLLNDIMSGYRAAIKSLGSEAIVGITDLVANEKDPRNLMVVFSVLRVIMVEWDISSHAETLFDAVFCYFPITFRPPPDDPYGITAQDLKDRLRECIASSGAFAPYVFPQLLDKLDSTSPNVKRDVMQTISSCALSYGLTTMSNYSVTLWDSLKFEILNVQEEDLAEEALKVLQSIAIRLSRGLDSTDPKTPLATYLRPITKECNEQLQQPQHKQARPAGQILSSIGISSPIAFHLIIKSTFPPLSTLYQAAESIPEQRALLEVLVQLMDSAIAIYGTLATPAPETNIENPLTPFKDRIFDLTSQALMSAAIDEVSFRIVALKALLRLCLLRKYLEDNEIGMVVQYLDEIALSEDPMGRDDLRKEAVQALVEISRIKPNLIMNITFPAFMARLPDSSPPVHRDYLITLEGLAQLSVDRFVADTLIRRLLSRLEVILNNESPSAYPQAIISTLHYVLGRRDLSSDPSLQLYIEKIVVGLTDKAAKACAGKAPFPALQEDITLERLGRLNMLIIRATDEHKQKSIAAQCYSLFNQDDTFRAIPFRQQVSSAEKMTLVLSTAIMASVSPSCMPQFVNEEGGSRQSLLAELVRMALTEEVYAIRQAILRQVGLLVNKFTPQQDIEYAKNTLFNLISGLVETTADADNAVRSMMWISKALILRLQSLNDVLDRLLALLSDGKYGAAVARGLGLLLAPDEILCKENGATIRLLAKQKVFNLCIPKVAHDFRNAESSVKPNYLVAMSGILRYMPTQVIMQEIDTLLPILLQSLELDDMDVKAATIKNLTVISEDSPAAVEDHVGSLVSRLLKSASDPKVNAFAVRLNALQCLKTFPGRVKDSTLLLYRNTVTRGLMAPLDDPKRDVRREAVECRAAWLNMDEPQSD